jgi:hypothetical protein
MRPTCPPRTRLAPPRARRSARGLLPLAALLAGAACGGKGDDSGSGGSTGEVIDGGGDGGEVECGGAPPTLAIVSCASVGLQPYDGGDYPTLQIQYTVNDEDGDLSAYSGYIYLDQVIDGAVSEESSPFTPVSGSAGPDECAEFDANLALNLGITGGNPAFNVEYEWGLKVVDAGGVGSELVVFTCITPKADGTDGDGSGVP